ncbi:hypothetical protein K469DRAFT_691728 [Zopfia rhizophila CBS 207.26]|uniref:Myb-like domain-containing protein n=1 Tax=Zopfia rhizophila CBS 207.26 TaxID=1314779 RepID=A0A6A6DTY7_9PEZI|nr:hypothetical protein K469DRAFT_691728 [Zopfia rhizophila CBS 207.26]
MSSDAGSQPPLPDGSDKGQAAKPAATGFSTFINKNTSRKFAPKAVSRRRGGATQPAQSTPLVTILSAEPQSGQTRSSDKPVSESAQTAQQAAATEPSVGQENIQSAAQDAPAAKTVGTEPSTSTSHLSIALTTLATTAEPAPQPSDVADSNQQAERGEGASGLSPARSATPRRTEEDLESGRSPKRRRVESPERTEEAPAPAQSTVTAITQAPLVTSQQPTQFVETRPTSPTARPTSEDDIETNIAVATSSSEALAEAENTDQNTVAADTPATDTTPSARQQTQPKKRRMKLPWATVNQPREDIDEDVEARANTQPTGKGKSKRKATTAKVTHNEEGVPEARAKQKSQSAKAKGKKKATGAALDDESGTGPTKKPCKARNDKSSTQKKGALNQAAEETEEPAATDEAHPKRRRVTKKKKNVFRTVRERSNEVQDGASTAEKEGEEDDEESGLRRRGRRRASTPLDAEERMIETDKTFMEDLASRNIRVGKLSQREKKMREINWAGVAQRRREEAERLAAAGGRDQDEVNERLNRAGEARNGVTHQGPQFREVDGQIVLVHESTVIDPQADANREAELLEQVEEDDLTRRINTKSWLGATKRNPQDRILVGGGKRWSQEATEQFYDALRMFGTDFQMISGMFPGTTRRSIKMKFVREERDSPDRVKAAVRGERTTDWNEYLKRTGKTDDVFKDPRELERQLKEEAKDMEEQIQAAKDAYEEEQRQKRLAGLAPSEDEAVDGSSKENRKKKKKKERQTKVMAPLEPEEGVEILGTVEDDDFRNGFF